MSDADINKKKEENGKNWLKGASRFEKEKRQDPLQTNKIMMKKVKRKLLR